MNNQDICLDLRDNCLYMSLI